MRDAPAKGSLVIRVSGVPGATDQVLQRLRDGFGGTGRAVPLAGFATLVVVAGVAATGAALNLLIPAVGLAGVLLVLLLTVRFPLLPLFVFIVLVPLEEALVIGELGTLSRYAALLFVVTYAIPRLGRIKAAAMPVAGWAFLVWAACSAAWAIDPDEALSELAVLVLLFTVAVLVADVVVHDPAIVRPALWAYSLSAACVAVLGVLAYAAEGLSGATRVAAFQGQNVAYFASIVLPALVFSFYELLRGRLVPLAAGVALVCTAGVVVSGTRGAWLGAIVVVALFVLPRLRPRQRIAAVAAVLAFLVVTLQIPGVAVLVAERADDSLSSGGAGRTDIWSVGLTIWQTSPVTGVGLANFPIAYTPTLVQQSNVSVYSTIHTAGRMPHSIVVGTLGELGVIGFVLLALFFAPLVIRRGWGPEAAAVQAVLASSLVLALFLDVLNRKEVWLVIGLACGLSYLARRPVSAVGASTSARAAAGEPDLVAASGITTSVPSTGHATGRRS
jgi:O-antigen ligase